MLLNIKLALYLISLFKVVRDAPWELNDEFITEHKIDFVAHDDYPYMTEDGHDAYGALKAKGMFVATQRTEGSVNTPIAYGLQKIVFSFDYFHIYAIL